jgi:hypothetical protein
LAATCVIAASGQAPVAWANKLEAIMQSPVADKNIPILMIRTSVFERLDTRDWRIS